MGNQASAGGGLALAEICQPLREWMSRATIAVSGCVYDQPYRFRDLEEFHEIAKSARVWPCHSSSYSEFCGECDFAIAQGVRLRLIACDWDILISRLCDGYATVVDVQFSPDEQDDCAVLSTAKESIDEFCCRNRVRRIALWVPRLPFGKTMSIRCRQQQNSRLSGLAVPIFMRW